MNVPANAGSMEDASHPVRQTTTRIMAVIRGLEALVFIPAAIAMAVPPTSGTWLAPVLVGFAAWAAVFAWTAASRGLTSWLVTGDVAVTTVLGLTAGHLVPLERVSDGSGWVAAAVSLCVVGIPLAWRAWLAIPTGLLVIMAFVAGYRLAGFPELGHQHAVMATGQLIASAVIMALVRRSSRVADGTLAAAHQERRVAGIRRARRIDERAQLRVLHDTALTTLTLVSTGVNVRADIVAKQAAADLATLERTTTNAWLDDDGLVRLDAVLAETVDRHSHLLTLDLTLVPCQVPAPVGAAFAGAVDEALRNVGRYAETGGAAVSIRQSVGKVCVEVSDAGAGFDPEATPPHRYGIKESIVGRMDEIGGRAAITTAFSAGTRWILEWPCARDA